MGRRSEWCATGVLLVTLAGIVIVEREPAAAPPEPAPRAPADPRLALLLERDREELARSRPPPPAPEPPRRVTPPEVSYFEGIKLVGSEPVRARVVRAIRFIGSREPETLAWIKEMIHTVREARMSGIHPDRKVFQLSARTAFTEVAWLASVLVHEATHGQLYRDRLARAEPGSRPPAHGGQAEELHCNAVQAAFLERIGGPRHLIDALRRADGLHFDTNGNGVLDPGDSWDW